jgi:hypothetical protein
MTDDRDVATIERAIRNAMLSYTRGIDRLNAALVSAAFHPGADLIDYGPAPMTIEQFVAHAMNSLETKFSATQHRVSNMTIEIADDAKSARVETYVLAFHVQPTDDKPLLHTFNGRYIDRFELRNGEWRIAKRVLRNDWSRIETIETPMRGSWQASGRAGSPDPLDT